MMATKRPQPISAGGNVSRKSSWAADGLPSPTSPLDRTICCRTPKNWKPNGVGLGIVLAALEDANCSTPAAPVSRAPHVSVPITIVSPRSNGTRSRWLEVSSELACSGRCSASSCGGGGNSVFSIGGCGQPEFEVADFLSCCYLCRRRLDGKDIFMYRGEKAFCSMECRYQQIVSDEYQEKDKCGASEASELAKSPYTGGRIFFTGIVAA